MAHTKFISLTSMTKPTRYAWFIPTVKFISVTSMTKPTRYV